MMEPCPLCFADAATLLHKGSRGEGSRDFLHCGLCDLVFVPRSQILDAESQKERYLHHNNDPDDQGYQDFLGRLYYQLKPHLKPKSRGLDYGAGPGPVLSAMMKQDGFDVYLYDIFFHPDRSVLDQKYDFITCTETAEHFSQPAQEFDRLYDLLRSPGWLGVMTGMLNDWADFPSWYYHGDPTHVNFYSRKTMQWIAEKYSWRLEFPIEHVALFYKD